MPIGLDGHFLKEKSQHFWKKKLKTEFRILQFFFCEVEVPKYCGTIYLCRSLRTSVLL